MGMALGHKIAIHDILLFHDKDLHNIKSVLITKYQKDKQCLLSHQIVALENLFVFQAIHIYIS
jgi:hypothetical protein